MSFVKMNTLHWHIVDDQSFPLQSVAYPKLTQAAWVPWATYSTADVKTIVAYATQRGIRVIPEFDTPAHSASWTKGYPNLAANCPRSYKLLDATDDNVYTFLTQFLTEISGLFPDQFIHMGGDEVSFDCWQADPKIQPWMTSHNMKGYVDLLNYYETKVQGIVHALKRTTVLWEESFDSGLTLSNDTVVNVWLSSQRLSQIIKSGHRATYSYGWYLDRQVPDPQTWYLWEDTWKDFYANDPVGNTTYTIDELSRLLGGEASMWGEQVDETCFDVRVWPRAAAVAERLWSPKLVTNVNDAASRLSAHRCNMVRRGINAGPIMPDYCVTGPAPEE